MKTYQVNEIFYSLQGEGVRAGSANVFIRMSGCNMRCRVEEAKDSPGGFDCDTEFASGRKLTIPEVIEVCKKLSSGCGWVVLTGGEPALQVDGTLIDALHVNGYKIAIETNGSIALPPGIDWITVSPKVAEHAIRQTTADEVKYVRHEGQAVPKTSVEARHHLISPAFASYGVDSGTLRWCVDLVKRHPQWRLSVQQHREWNVR